MSNLRLDSWKSIADYLGRGVRTVERWHSDYRMPVHHFGGSKGRVFAYTDDLDRWFLERSGMIDGEEARERSTGDANKARTCQLITKAEAMREVCSERNLSAIISLYREAIDTDPGNRAALAGLSRSLIMGALLGVVDGFVAYPSAAEALSRISADGLGYEDSDALCVGAWLNMVYLRRWREARTVFDEVLKKKPSDMFALAGRALMYVAEGKLPEAFESAWASWSENPLAAPLSMLAAWIQYLNQEYDDALELLADTKVSGGYGANHAAVEALTLTQAGELRSNLDRIVAIAADYPQSQLLGGVLGYSYAAAGRPGKAWEILSSLMQSNKRAKRSSNYHLALILLGLDEKQEAQVWLGRSFAEGSFWSLGFPSDPILQTLRGGRSFEALLRRIGPQEEREGASVDGITPRFSRESDELLEDSNAERSTPIHAVTLGAR